MKQYIADAFTEELFGGNPAAVLPCNTMPPAGMMQKIAIENNYSETAFVVKKGDGQYDLKWFTPGGEVDLCGHATLATAFILHNFADKGVEEMHFHTLSGELIVKKEGEGFAMDFPLGKTKQVPVTDDMRKATDGLVQEAWYDGGDLVIVIEDEDDLVKFEPNGELIAKLEGLGLIITAKSKKYDFVSRCFYPKLNVLEDPVTGRAHTFTGPIWAEKLRKNVMTAGQLSRRGGTMTVRVKGDRVFLTGKVQLFMEGDIPFEL